MNNNLDGSRVKACLDNVKLSLENVDNKLLDLTNQITAQIQTVLQPKLALLESLPQSIQSMSTALQENQSESHESLSRIFQTFADRLLLSQVALLKETITSGARERDEYREQEMQRAETKQVEMYQKFSSLSNRLLDLKTLIQTRQDEWIIERRRNSEKEEEARNRLIKEISLLKGSSGSETVIRRAATKNMETQTDEGERMEARSEKNQGVERMEGRIAGYPKPWLSTDALHHFYGDTSDANQHRDNPASQWERCEGGTFDEQVEEDLYARSDLPLPEFSQPLPMDSRNSLSTVDGGEEEINEGGVVISNWESDLRNEGGSMIHASHKRRRINQQSSSPSISPTTSTYVSATLEDPWRTQAPSDVKLVIPPTDRRNKRVLIQDDSDTDFESDKEEEEEEDETGSGDEKETHDKGGAEDFSASEADNPQTDLVRPHHMLIH